MQVSQLPPATPEPVCFNPHIQEIDNAIATCDSILKFSDLSDSAKNSAFKARIQLAKIRKEIDKLNEAKLRDLRPAPKPKSEPAVTASSAAKSAAEAIAQVN